MTRFVVVIEHLTVSGGLYRFERVGRELKRLGVDLCWLSLAETTIAQRPSDFPMLTHGNFESSGGDIFCVPGAGFSRAFFACVARLRERHTGRWIQHVLNDPHRLEAFTRMNEAFKPDIVIFNNRHWSASEAARLTVGKHEVLEGAVDAHVFHPRSTCQIAATAPHLLTLANKNPGPVINAARLLNGRCTLVGNNLRGIPASDKVTLSGPVDERKLGELLRQADFVCHTETNAGWANLAAEAAAVGTPLIATPAGTQAFLTHGATGFVIQEPTAEAIAASVRSALADPDATAAMAAEATRRIGAFDWRTYTETLLELSL